MYCQPDDLTTLLPKERLLELADDNRDQSGTWDAAAVQAVLRGECDGASREIDSLLGNRYAVPLDPVPDVVADWTKRLAVARLFLRRPDLEGEATDRWRKEGDRILKLLEKAGAGQLSLGAPSRTEQSQPDDESVAVATCRRLFGPEVWEQY